MGAKASIHMQPMKAMNASLSDENERRDKSKEWFDRTEDSNGTPYHYDWWRRNLNFEIVKGKICPQLSHAIPLHDRIQNRLRELGFKNYKETAKNAPNVCMDFVIGGQRERLREMAFGKQYVNFDEKDEQNSHVKRCDEIERWAMDTYKWAAKKYGGEENIIGFNVHLDETTPHIHMQVIPVAEKKRRGRVKTGQERGTVKTVSYAGIVGETPEALSKYLDDMHTDYHLQVGYKYGLERGTFFDDLTPEEQARRKNRSKPEYVEYDNLMKEIDKTKKNYEELKQDYSQLEEQYRLLEKKVKSFTKMLSNLNDQKERLEIDITALEEIRDTGNEEVEKQLEEKRKQLDDITEKISLRKGQLNDVTEELKKLDEVRDQTKQDIKNMVTDAIQRHDRTNAWLKEADRAIEEKRKKLTEMDKTGELENARRHVDERDAVLYRRWPEARDAVNSIFEFASSSSVHDFTPQQALHVEHAIVTSGTTRTKAAEELMSLAKKDFDNNRTYSGWVNGVMLEVMKIASNTHQRLNALLKTQPKNKDGSPSYITDLTDWAGNQLQR